MKASLVATLLLASVSFAEPPKITLPKQVEGQTGQWVSVKGETDAKNIKFVSLSPSLYVFPVESLFPPEMTGGLKTALVQSNTPGTYKLLAYTGNADGGSIPYYVDVVIGGVIPPNPIPTPPNPVPVPPNPVPPQPTLSELANASYTGAAKVVYNNPAAKKADQKKLATFHTAFASAIRAGGITNPKTGNFDDATALSMWREGIKGALDVANTPVDESKWWIEWSNVVSPALEQHYKSGKITKNDKATWAKAFEEIGLGIASYE